MLFDPFENANYYRYEDFIDFNEFTLYDTTNKLQNKNFKFIRYSKIDEVIKKISHYKKETELVIIKTIDFDEEDSVNISVFDKSIIIFDQIYYSVFLENIKNIIDSKKIHFFDDQKHNANEKNNNNQNLVFEQIVKSILYKSQLRSKMRHEELIYNYDIEKKEINSDDLFQINSNNNIVLCFNKNDQILYILKKCIGSNESDFYEIMDNKCPFIPKYFGKITYDENDCIIMEYIEGKELSDMLDNIEILKKYDKIKIILQLLTAVEYIHFNKFIIKDINFNNILIDENNDLTLIDFDHSKQEIGPNTEFTANIGSPNTMAPEQYKNGEYSQKSDIFSIGIIINSILSEMQKEISVFNECTEDSSELRPNISSIINNFFKKIGFNLVTCPITDENKDIKTFIKRLFEVREKMLQTALTKTPHQEELICLVLLFFCTLHCLNEYVPMNSIIAYSYLKKLAEYDFYFAKHFIERIDVKHDFDLKKTKELIGKFIVYKEKDEKDYYSDGELFYKSCMIDKNCIKLAIKYLKKASNLNDPRANYLLSPIYYNNLYTQQDIEMSLKYLNLALSQHNSDAQYFYGCLCYNDRNFRNINKSIKYLTLSSEQNNPNAQYYLGFIYFIDEDVRDIDKAIEYLERSAEQNNSNAQFLLGVILYTDKHFLENFKSIKNESDFNYYVIHFLFNEIYCNNYPLDNIEQAIHYLKLSANQNDKRAQYLLYSIYINKTFIPRNDVDIEYFDTLFNKLHSSRHHGVDILQLFKSFPDQNNPNIQCIIGELYYRGIEIRRDIEKSLFYLDLSAKQNHPHALYLLGEIYFKGNIVQQDMQKAFIYFFESSKYDYPESLYSLGLFYYHGYTGEKDIKKSIPYLQKAASKNHSAAQCLLGEILYKGENGNRDFKSAIKYLESSGRQNNSYAQFLLGEIYFKGIGVPKDIDKSIDYLQKAASQNNSDAMLYLGLIFYENDPTKGLYYFELSIQQSNSYAQYIYGILYYNGLDVNQDINKSIYYLTLSSDQNNPHAQLFLGKIYYDGIYVQKDIHKSIHYLELSSKSNQSEAQYLLGYIYLTEKEFQENINLSIKYLQLSAENFQPKALYLLGVIYYYSVKYIQRDITKSIKYFKESSNLNNSFAKNFLGIIYKNGDGVEKNIYCAIDYFEQAIRNDGCLFALYNLSRIYYFGEGVEKNVNQSINYLKIAADKGLKPAILFLCVIFRHEDKTKLYTKIEHIMLEFFRQYDLVGTDFFLDEFIYFIKYGNLMSNKRFEVADQDKRRPIDSFFRDGFSL